MPLAAAAAARAAATAAGAFAAAALTGTALAWLLWKSLGGSMPIITAAAVFPAAPPVDAFTSDALAWSFGGSLGGRWRQLGAAGMPLGGSMPARRFSRVTEGSYTGSPPNSSSSSCGGRGLVGDRAR